MRTRLGREVRVRTRRPLGAIVAVRISREMLTAIDAEATKRDIWMSDVIREAIAAHLDKEKT